jgi:hypothetical protein
MVEAGGRAGLGDVGFNIFGLGNQPTVGHLDRHAPLQLLVVGQVDDAEAALSQDSLDPVATDALGMFGRGLRWGRGLREFRSTGTSAIGVVHAPSRSQTVHSE